MEFENTWDSLNINSFGNEPEFLMVTLLEQAAKLEEQEMKKKKPKTNWFSRHRIHADLVTTESPSQFHLEIDCFRVAEFWK
mmetsp:Transcript_4539/g.6854  ORF Transcript_4539/g.6854 Transcript_4539/m.6854 type:complete len:81 (-) Transcript_4539:1242-1484(-)|eukprot:CAMPEP_0170502170 /NCGR_PEP_ID=MMETSP0208-20121228/40661_1 /TAXON_ID=197538 /ORGANISM="Strombidium inclinatum, Strain S3" /LENGTH=80 /DNA_ID=CAMNT_0010781085 /DNA_START=733 /DNA_END=975 /DNA_ORIENTATION=-